MKNWFSKESCSCEEKIMKRIEDINESMRTQHSSIMQNMCFMTENRRYIADMQKEMETLNTKLDSLKEQIALISNLMGNK